MGSLWIGVFDGKHSGMICTLATHSKRAIAVAAHQQIGDQGRPTLAGLIDNLAVTKNAAEAACTKLSNIEEKYRGADGKLASVATPKVCGGMTKASTIIYDGKTTQIEPHEWFFRSREEIEEEDTAEQLADLDRQAKANARAYPKELRRAAREQLRALDIWTAAERALTKYKPASMAEAVELLSQAGKPAKPYGWVSFPAT